MKAPRPLLETGLFRAAGWRHLVYYYGAMRGEKAFKFRKADLAWSGLLQRYADAVPAALLVLFWGLLYFHVLFQGQTFVLEDSSRVFYPLWKWGSEAWKKGTIPLWNPDVAFGTPSLADPQMAAWYPPVRLLYGFLDPTSAFTLLVVLHHLWALCGFWIFARCRGFMPWLCLGGSLVFGFSFNALSLTWATPMLFAYSWIPWIFYFIDGLRRGHRRSFLGLSAALALQMAAGYPLFSFLTLFLMAWEWSLTRATQGWKGNWQRETLEQGAAVLMAMAYNAAWTLPLRELLPQTFLNNRLALSESLHWEDLTTWLNPFFKGHPLHAHPSTPFSVVVYFAGLPTLVVFLWGTALRKARVSSLLLLLLPLLLSLGETGWLGSAIKTIFPVYRMVVRSGCWIPFVVWSAALFFLEAGQGLCGPAPGRKKEGKRPVPRRQAAWLIFSIGVYLCALACGVPSCLLSFWISLGLLLAISWASQPVVRAAFLCGSLFFSLGPVDQSIHFTMDRSFYDNPPSLAGLLSKPGPSGAAPGRLYQTPDWVDEHLMVSGQGVADAYLKVKNSLAPNWPLCFGLVQADYENTLFLKPALGWLYLPQKTKAETSRKILDFLGIGFVMGIPAPPGMDESDGEIWKNPTKLPIWFPVERALDWNSQSKLGDPFEAPKFDLKKEVVTLEHNLVGNYAPRKVSEEFRSANEIRISASGHGRALLASSEMAYPGWWARVNGVFRPLETVNGNFRGLVLNEGETEVEVVYRPLAFRLGCFLSLLACGVWAFMILRPVLRY